MASNMHEIHVCVVHWLINRDLLLNFDLMLASSLLILFLSASLDLHTQKIIPYQHCHRLNPVLSNNIYRVGLTDIIASILCMY